MLKRFKFFLDRQIIIKIFILGLIALLFLGKSLNDIEPYPTGDGCEYIMMTEAIYNHFTPDLREGDVQSFKTAFLKVQDWTKNYRYEEFDNMEMFLSNKNLKFFDRHGGIYVDKNKKMYPFHFFAYSAINVPGRWIADLVKVNPMFGFQVTNAYLIIITCFFILFFSPFSFWKTVLAALIFSFSSAYWYLGWTHPEVFTICFVTLGFWFYFQEKYYLAILLIAIASMQNQPLIVMLAFVCFRTLFVKGFNLKNISIVIACALPFIFPPLFYYSHFGTTNLIKDAGFLSTEYLTFTRIFGFYFDVNQGVILAIPLILCIYLFFILRKVIFVVIKSEKFEYNDLLPLFIFAMTFIVATMGNWNHGQAVINRYASWFSAIILIHTLFISEKHSYIVSLVLFNYYFLTQAFTALYHEQFSKFDWGQDSHKPLAKWFLENHPELYNPDPQIFIIRTTETYDLRSVVSPVFHIKNFQTITKIAVHKDSVKGLELYGFSKKEVERITPQLKYINDWAYLNKGEFKTSMTGNEIYAIKRKIKLGYIENKIRGSNHWMKLIEEKAKNWGKTIEEVIKEDAEYIIHEEEKKER